MTGITQLPSRNENKVRSRLRNFIVRINNLTIGIIEF